MENLQNDPISDVDNESQRAVDEETQAQEDLKLDEEEEVEEEVEINRMPEEYDVEIPAKSHVEDRTNF